MKLADFKDAMDMWRTPERIVFITSVDSDGKPAIITVGWKCVHLLIHPLLQSLFDKTPICIIVLKLPVNLLSLFPVRICPKNPLSVAFV